MNGTLTCKLQPLMPIPLGSQEYTPGRCLGFLTRPPVVYSEPTETGTLEAQ